MSRPRVCGVGIYEQGVFSAKHTVNGKKVKTKEYNAWSHMLERCYGSYRESKFPAYKYCIVSEDFKNFQYFAEWCQGQVGFKTENYQLDKDILFKGNKEYSKNTCVFVPPIINSLLISCISKRGKQPIGVYYHIKYDKYVAQIRYAGSKKQQFLGQYKTSEEAFLIYKAAKEKYIKQISEQYKDQVDPRVYNALMNYEVEITD